VAKGEFLRGLTSHPWHVRYRSVVLPKYKLLYVPVPKAGCTSLLWLLARLGGRDEADFETSRSPSVSPDMLVHDLSVWDPAGRLSEYPDDRAEEMWTGDDWFRFTVVREPAARIWSAWQSKLLLREPGFVRRFEATGWIPDPPTSATQVRDEFGRFLRGVADSGPDSPRDVHWATQAAIVGQLPLTHVGRIAELSRTLDRLRAWVGVDLPDLPTANPSPLRFASALLDDDARRTLNGLTAMDRERFGYPPVAAPTDPADELARWQAAVEPMLPLVRELIQRHRRIDQLARLARPASAPTEMSTTGA
jgi:Sulfotransferase family